jgi:hypothetical protein
LKNAKRKEEKTPQDGYSQAQKASAQGQAQEEIVSCLYFL